jgi:CHAT domain-containing protein
MKGIGDGCNLPRRMKDLAVIKVQQGKVNEANALYDEISDITEGMIAASNTAYAKSSLIGSLSDIYLSHFILIAEHLNDPAKAFSVLERARGRSVSDVLQNPPQSENQADLQKTPLQRDLSNLNRRLLHSASPSEREELLLQILESEQRLGPAIAQQNLYRRAITGRPVSLKVLQEGLLDDELLLEYVLSEPVSYCLEISRTEVWLHRIASRNDLDSLVDGFLREVRSQRPAHNERQQLCRLLLEPTSFGNYSRLIIVPDGNLHLLPFDSLVDRKLKNIVETHVVSYVPSGTSLHLLRTAGSQLQTARKFLGVGGVLYSSNGKPSLPAPARTLFKVEATRIGSLPGSEKEVLSIGRLFEKDATLLVGRKATESALKSQPLEEFRILHLAVHGFTDLTFPERTTLVLAEDRNSPEDSLLQDREIRDLRLSADLVTLSACDTGIGRIQGQEGISNLVQAFFLAGAKTVVASLWNADDEATTTLMKDFYSYLEGGRDKAAALRLAKLDVIRQFRQDAVPYYWAGFTIHGDSASIIRSRARN